MTLVVISTLQTGALPCLAIDHTPDSPVASAIVITIAVDEV